MSTTVNCVHIFKINAAYLLALVFHKLSKGPLLSAKKFKYAEF